MFYFRKKIFIGIAFICAVIAGTFYTPRDSKIGSAVVRQPPNLRPACIDNLFKFICFGVGSAWLKFGAPSWHFPTFESLAVYFAEKMHSPSPFTFTEPPEDFSPQFEVAGCFCEHEGKFLYLLRNPEKPQGNTWCVPGGKLESGETPLDAVIREVEEEIGIRIPEQSLIFCRKVYVRLSERDFILHLFKAKLEEMPKAFTIALDEHIGFQWVTYAQAFQMPLIPGGKECLNYVCSCSSF